MAFRARAVQIGRQVGVVVAALHVLAITIGALPSPAGGLNRADWRQPTVQAEFEAWAGRLRAVGIAVESEALQDRMHAVAVGWYEAHRTLRAPFEPYYRTCGTHQTWRMFIAPHRFPSRLQIRVEEGGAWRVVYEERDPQATWLGHALDHDRMRSAIFRYGWGRKYESSWRGFGDWVAREAAVAFPDAARVELRFASYRTPTPAETRAGVTPKITWHRRRAIPLEPLR